MAASDLLEELFGIAGRAIVSRVTGALEGRRRILLSERDRRSGGQFGRKLKTAPENAHLVVSTTVYRSAFLWACANAVKGQDHEVMILGFGRTSGTRNTITSFMKIAGGKHEVSLTPGASSTIVAHLAADNRNSVILVHNHPDHVLSAALKLFLGPEPLPSLTDRDTALSSLLARLREQMQGNRWGSIRFFLVEDDDVAEFSGLNTGTVVDFLRRGVR